MLESKRFGLRFQPVKYKSYCQQFNVLGSKLEDSASRRDNRVRLGSSAHWEQLPENTIYYQKGILNIDRPCGQVVRRSTRNRPSHDCNVCYMERPHVRIMSRASFFGSQGASRTSSNVFPAVCSNIGVSTTFLCAISRPVPMYRRRTSSAASSFLVNDAPASSCVDDVSQMLFGARQTFCRVLTRGARIIGRSDAHRAARSRMIASTVAADYIMSDSCPSSSQSQLGLAMRTSFPSISIQYTALGDRVPKIPASPRATSHFSLKHEEGQPYATSNDLPRYPEPGDVVTGNLARQHQ
jgi:hypothetical protein